MLLNWSVYSSAKQTFNEFCLNDNGDLKTLLNGKFPGLHPLTSDGHCVDCDKQLVYREVQAISHRNDDLPQLTSASNIM